MFFMIFHFLPHPQAGGGSGLGLMITKGIVDLHRGSISVFSGGIGKGCTVSIILPLTTSAAGPAVPYNAPEDVTISSFIPLSSPTATLPTTTAANSFHRQSTLGLTDSSTTRETLVNELDTPIGEISWHEGPSVKKEETVIEDEKLGNIEVLVVDDSKLSRRMLLRYLQGESYTCDEAEDGLVAVQKVLKRRQGTSLEDVENSKEMDTDEIPGNVLKMYDVILMDFMMPVMDGPTATRKIRDMGYEGLILGVTGNALPSDIDLFMGHGADRVLTKPVNVDSLKIALKGVKLRRDLRRNRIYAN
jgi:CheY-like chemotaxis protein